MPRFCTADNAYLLDKMVDGIDVFGGIVLNLNYGPTVNVNAAKSAVRLTGGYCRCIWMPTYQSAYDYGRKNMKGVPVVDSTGKVLPEVVSVMEICRDEDIISPRAIPRPTKPWLSSKKLKKWVSESAL